MRREPALPGAVACGPGGESLILSRFTSGVFFLQQASLVTVPEFVLPTSVPDPLKGLMEVKRVLKPCGRFYAIEHVRPGGRTLGNLFDRIAPAVERRSGVCINRNTVDNIRRSGFTIEKESDLFLDIFKLIIARPY